MTVTTIALSQLRLSPLNARKVPSKTIEMLAEDIAAHGLIQSIAVYKEGKYYMVFAGGRRLAALEILKKRKIIDGTYEVAATIRTKTEAIELSTAENAQRDPMHRADAARAFVTMRDEGHAPDEIAARFGQSVGWIGRMLKVGSIAPALLDAYGEDKVSQATAEALALIDDHSAQIEAFEEHGNNAARIRKHLTREKVDIASGPFKFIGEDAYCEAGGHITRNLFGDDAYADHPEILDALVNEKLDAVRKELTAQGWSVVEVSDEAPDNIYYRPSLIAATLPPTEAQQIRMSEIENRLEEIDEIDEEHLTREEYTAIQEESDNLSEELSDIRDSLDVYTDEQKEIGGACAYISYGGALTYRFWRTVKESTSISAKKAEDKAANGNLPANLIERMTAIRTMALQQSIASQPDLALDIMIDTMAAKLLHSRLTGSGAADILPSPASINIEPELIDNSGLIDMRANLMDRYAEIPEEGRFETIRAMAHDDKMQLLAALVAVTVNGTIFAAYGSGDRQKEAERYAQAANLDVGKYWTPNQPFFDRLGKTVLLDAISNNLGEEVASNCTKMKKADLAIAANERLPTGWLPERIKSFLPTAKKADVTELAQIEDDQDDSDQAKVA